jgi:hypothetical protein
MGLKRKVMKTVEDLVVRVTYQVQLHDVEMPQEVYDQIIKSSYKGGIIELNGFEFQDAADWLSNHINEGDSVYWRAEADIE